MALLKERRKGHEDEGEDVWGYWVNVTKREGTENWKRQHWIVLCEKHASVTITSFAARTAWKSNRIAMRFHMNCSHYSSALRARKILSTDSFFGPFSCQFFCFLSISDPASKLFPGRRKLFRLCRTAMTNNRYRRQHACATSECVERIRDALLSFSTTSQLFFSCNALVDWQFWLIMHIMMSGGYAACIL